MADTKTATGENENWLWDSLADLHVEAQRIIAERLARIRQVNICDDYAALT